jgi:ketosteroid isomerase-like protein
MKKLFFLTAIILIAGNSCQNKNDIDADKQALIKLAAEDWTMNVLAGKGETNVESYTEDALRINHEKILSGKEAIRGAFNLYAKQTTILKLENKVEDTWISGDLATVRGSYSETFIRKEIGDTIYEKGAWVDVCERQADGSWKMALTLITVINN